MSSTMLALCLIMAYLIYTAAHIAFSKKKKNSRPDSLFWLRENIKRNERTIRKE